MIHLYRYAVLGFFGLNLMVLVAGCGASLHEAVRLQDQKLVLSELKQGSNVNRMDRFGRTPLIWAAYYGDPLIARILLEAKPDLDTQDYTGQSALMLSARFGRLDLVQLLIEKGAAIDLVDKRGLTAKELAKKHGHGEVVGFIEEKLGACKREQERQAQLRTQAAQSLTRNLQKTIGYKLDQKLNQDFENRLEHRMRIYEMLLDPGRYQDQPSKLADPDTEELRLAQPEQF